MAGRLQSFAYAKVFFIVTLSLLQFPHFLLKLISMDGSFPLSKVIYLKFEARDEKSITVFDVLFGNY